MSFNISGGMEDWQVVDAVTLIAKDYHYFKPEDFKKCFENVKKGYYGADKLYNRIDCAVVYGWLNAYDTERTEEVERLRQQEGREHKQAATDLAGLLSSATGIGSEDDVFKRNFEKLKADRQKRVEAKQVQPKPLSPRENNPIYQMHQQWFREFDRLYFDQNRNDGTVRFVKRWGKMLDANSFLEHRQLQYMKVQNWKHERVKILQVDRVP